MTDQEQIVTMQKDNGDSVEYRKDDMTEEQQQLMEQIVSYQQRLIQLEPLAREFADKKELVNVKSELFRTLLEESSGEDNASNKKENDTEDNG